MSKGKTGSIPLVKDAALRKEIRLFQCRVSNIDLGTFRSSESDARLMHWKSSTMPQNEALSITISRSPFADETAMRQNAQGPFAFAHSASSLPSGRLTDDKGRYGR
jgi:hypothetical protein